MSAGMYRIDSTRVTLKEYAWGTPALMLPIATLLKLLRVRINGSTDDPNVESLAPFEVDVLPADAAERMASALDELKAAGFENPIVHAIEDDFHHARTYLVTLSHGSGRAAARVHNRVWTAATPPRNIVFTEFLTEFEDGTYLWSLSSKPDMAAPPACTVVREQGASPTALWRLHRYALQRRPAKPAVKPVTTADDVRALVERHHAAVRDFHVARGVFAPMATKEIEERDRFEADRRQAEASGLRHGEVYAEIQRLERKQSSWTNTLLVLAASLGLFIASGGGLDTSAARFSWRQLLILLAVLFFHESGHYLAMRLFDYRNLRMFFIPFFGAAVSGRHYNVPGWKKAIVSLMGPLPGIAAGIVLGTIGLWFGKPLLIEASLMAVALNGFNLIPVLPLDGGWVMHTLLFSRHPLLDLLFRITAVLALVGLSIATGDNITRYLAIFMAIGLPLPTGSPASRASFEPCRCPTFRPTTRRCRARRRASSSTPWRGASAPAQAIPSSRSTASWCSRP